MKKLNVSPLKKIFAVTSFIYLRFEPNALLQARNVTHVDVPVNAEKGAAAWRLFFLV